MNEIEPRDFASGIPVYCAFDKIVDVKELKPNPKNPNKHPDEQIKMLAKVIKQNGWRDRITVSKQSGMIVKGHGRLLAAKLLKLKEVPVDYQDYASESLELADLMADNRLAELSKNDNRKLLNLFEEFDSGEVDFETSGYTSEEYQKLAHKFDEWQPKEDEEENKEEESTGTKLGAMIVCPACGWKFEVQK
jgi:ParB-like chromosome segregation protein Spo0J